MQICSSAFVPGQKQIAISSVHQILRNCKSIDKAITIRNFQKQDVQQLRKLQQEWFPIKYTNAFYEKLLKKMSQCYLAVTEVEYIDLEEAKENKIEIIVGALVFQFSSAQNYLGKTSWWEYISVVNSAVYIMTLGVIDQYRNQGVAGILIERLRQQCQKYQQIKLIYLHLITYNLTAERFYLKNGFEQLDTFEAYYNIENNLYQGKAMGLYINGGNKKQTWGQWFKSFFVQRQNDAK